MYINYEKNKHIGYVRGTVRLPYQRKKIASKTLQLLAIEAKKVGLKSIESGVIFTTFFMQSYRYKNLS